MKQEPTIKTEYWPNGQNWYEAYWLDVKRHRTDGQDGDAISGLVSRGLMEEFKTGYYRATERGMALAGAPV